MDFALSERAAEGRADGRADSGDFIFGLEGLDAKVFEVRQALQDRAGGGDRIAAIEQGPVRQLRSGDKTEHGGLVAVSYTHLTLPTNREV